MRSHSRAHAAAFAFLLSVCAGLSSAPSAATTLPPSATAPATQVTTDPTQFCPIYPMALPAAQLAGATAGQHYERVVIGGAAGIAWLTWSGNSSAQTLERSLLPPGDSDTYVDPDDASDHRLDREDWAKSVSGNINASGVRTAVDALLGREVVLPVWTESRGQGGRTDYRIAKFALVRLTSADISGQGTLSFDYLRDYRCYNAAPVTAEATHMLAEDGSASIVLQATDANGDALTWSVVSTTTRGTLVGTAPNLTYTPAPNYFGDDQFTFKASDGELESNVATIRLQITPVNDAPVAAPLEIETDQGIPVALSLSASDIDDSSLAYRIVDGPAHGSLSGTAPTLSYNPVATFSGQDSFTYVAHDGDVDSAPAVVSINVKPRQAQTCEEPDQDGDGLLDPACMQPYSPADPRTLAPPNDPSVSTAFLDSFGFLTGGPQPIQRGVAAGEIEAKTAAVLRGRVLDGNGQPLRGALVRVAGRPEFGYTYSRADGYYDLLVNGGGTLHLDFQADGYIRAQRPADAPWQDFANVDDVALVRLDPNATQVSFSTVSPPQVVRGSAVADAQGERQATLFIPAATEASIALHDGTTRPMSSLTLRATEFTVGPNGPKRMPGALPASSGYTYAVELSADEALGPEAESVRFSRPVAFYVENFLEFPVGTKVPVGYYDFGARAWRASDNGKIIKILAVGGGSATLDIVGNGIQATPAELSALGIDGNELAMLAQTYAAGTSLWRAPIQHLTPWDLNYPVKTPDDATQPDYEEPESELEEDEDEQDEECGSIIGCQNSSLGEAIAIPGSPVVLHYDSTRADGMTAYRKASLKLKGETLPASLKAIELTWKVAGHTVRQRISSPQPGAAYDYTWDGKDVYGRNVVGSQTLSAEVSYIYAAVYSEPADVQRSFGVWSASGATLSLLSNRAEIGVSAESRIQVRGKAIDPSQLGGFQVADQHGFDMSAATLYAGNGKRQSVTGMPKVGRLVVGSYSAGNSLPAEGKKVTEFRLPTTTTAAGFPVHDMALLPNGDLLVTDGHNADGYNVWRIGADGVARNFLGSTTNCLDVCITDGVAATTPISFPTALAVDGNGTVYVAMMRGHVLRVRDGKVELAWRTPTAINLTSMTLAKDGRMFLGVQNGAGIYQIDPSGQPGSLSTTSYQLIAGTDRAPPFNGTSTGYSGSGGPATQALINVGNMAIGPDGLLYLGERWVIRRIELDGRITRIAGEPPSCPGSASSSSAWTCHNASTLNSLAVDSQISIWGGQHNHIAFLPDGDLIFSEKKYRSAQNTDVIRRIDKQGYIRAFRTGLDDDRISCPTTPAAPACQLDAPSEKYVVKYIRDMEIDATGALLVLDPWFGVVHRLGTVVPQMNVTPLLVPSRGGSTAHAFDEHGRHTRTVDTTTGRVLRTFEYDAAARLIGILDANGQRTRIERTASGLPRAVVAPHGQRTELEFDANGRLAVVRDPLRNEHRMSYGAGGLMRTFGRPGAAASTMTYAADGRLESDVNPLSGGWLLDRADLAGGKRVTLTSAEGRLQVYDRTVLPGGEKVRTNTHRDGSVSKRTERMDGSVEHVAANGNKLTTTVVPDPRFGLMAPIQSKTLVTPQGRTLTSTRTKSWASASADPSSPRSSEVVYTVNGRIYRRQYDAGTRTLTVTSPANRRITTTFDTDGRPQSVAVPGLPLSSYQYDSSGRLETVSHTADGHTRTTRFGYDSLGFVTSVFDPSRRSMNLSNDALGQVKTQTLPDQRRIGFSHDARGNLTGITPPGRAAHGFGYNDLSQLTSYAPPAVSNGGMTAYAYNRDRQLELITRPDGLTVDLQYESASGRLLALDTAEGATSFSWLPGQRVGTISAPGGNTLTYAWDGSLVTQVASAGAAPGTVRYFYDNNMWLVGVSAPGALVDYRYDTDGLLTSAKLGAASSLVLTRSATNGLIEASTIGQLSDTWSRNGFAEPLSYDARFGTAPLFSATYTRDDLGRIAQRSESSGGESINETYAYDAAGRLDVVNRGGALASDYRFDENGNRVEHRIGAASPLRGRTLACLGELAGTSEFSVLAQYDAQDRMTSYGTCAYDYTANGELSRRVDTSTNSVTRFRYDVFGNLREATLPNQTRIEYDVDGNNRRIGRRVNGTRVQGFLYLNQLEPIAELDGNGTVIASFAYADRTNTPSLMLKGGKTYRFVTDHLGSVRLVIDIATGAIAQRMDYDEYGNVVLDTSPGFQPFGYAGGIYDRDTGLTRFGARDYDPVAGRWTSKDPIGFGGEDSNIYAYVGGNPVNFTDPSGLIKLPSDPSGLPSNWTPDPSHRDPNGERWTNGEDVLDFHKGRPGKPGWRGKDHWHHDEGEKHYSPGEECPTSDTPPEEAQEEDKEFIEKMEELTGLTGAALILYLIISEGSRVFPPRNLVPVP